MGRPRQISDEQILHVMRERVLSEGPHVSLEVVADALDVTVPALLKRFGNRQTLMLAALTPESPSWIQHAAAGPDDRPLQKQLLGLMEQIDAFLQVAVPCLSALRESGIPPHQIFCNGRGPAEGLEALQRWLTAARKKGLVTVPEVGSAAYAILGALQTRAFLSHMTKTPFSDKERRAYIGELSRLFTRALAP